MVMNVLGENSGPVYTGHQKMEAVGPGQITCSFISFIHLLCILSIHTRSKTEPIGYRACHDANVV